MNYADVQARLEASAAGSGCGRCSALQEDVVGLLALLIEVRDVLEMHRFKEGEDCFCHYREIREDPETEATYLTDEHQPECDAVRSLLSRLPTRT